MRTPCALAFVLVLAVPACGTTVPAPASDPVLVIVDGAVEGPGISGASFGFTWRVHRIAGQAV